MEKSQSLTPEVVAILSEIREQAHKYNQAFETFQTLVSEAEALQKHSDDYFERLESKTLRLAEEFQKTSEESVAKVNAKLTSIDHIFHELETIQAVKASLQTLEDTFKKNTSSLAGVVENIKTLVIRQVEKETARLDRKINVLNEEHTEQLGRVSRHCLATGLLSRYVFARMQRDEPFESELQADELFAAGVLHDLGLGLLSVLDPG